MRDILELEKSCTNHSIKRVKQRAGLNEKRAVRMIELARQRGYRASDCRWSADRHFLEKNSNAYIEAVAYNNYCFIFNLVSGKCITVYKLPQYFGCKKMQYSYTKSQSTGMAF